MTKNNDMKVSEEFFKVLSKMENLGDDWAGMAEELREIFATKAQDCLTEEQAVVLGLIF